jgi:hypothetical protein
MALWQRPTRHPTTRPTGLPTVTPTEVRELQSARAVICRMLSRLKSIRVGIYLAYLMVLVLADALRHAYHGSYSHAHRPTDPGPYGQPHYCPHCGECSER